MVLAFGLVGRATAEDGSPGQTAPESGTSAESKPEGERERPESEREEPEKEEEKEEHIETDRDSFTPSTRTVEQGRTVLEAAYTFVDNRNTADTTAFPSSLRVSG